MLSSRSSHAAEHHYAAWHAGHVCRMHMNATEKSSKGPASIRVVQIDILVVIVCGQRLLSSSSHIRIDLHICQQISASLILLE